MKVNNKKDALKKCPSCKKKLKSPQHAPSIDADYSQVCKCGVRLCYMVRSDNHGLFLHKIVRPN